MAAVSEDGGLGTLGAGYMQPRAIRDDAVREIQILTDAPFAGNLFVPESSRELHSPAEPGAPLASYRRQLGLNEPGEFSS